MSRVVLSIGSNLGDRLAHLQSAVDGLAADVRAVSSVYETEPFGTTEPQDSYFNAILLVESDVDGAGWLRRARRLEGVAQRVRTTRWGPRTLDVDVISVDQMRSEDSQLTLPHPRAHERAFVLAPWLEVDPAAVLPGRGPVAELLRELDTSTVHKRLDRSLVRR